MKTKLSNYIDIIGFLIRAEDAYKEKSKKQTSLEDKLKYKKKANDIKIARITLRSLHFNAEDYFNTGKIEASKLMG